MMDILSSWPATWIIKTWDSTTHEAENSPNWNVLIENIKTIIIEVLIISIILMIEMIS